MRREGKESREEGEEGREGKTERKKELKPDGLLSLPSLRNVAEGLCMSGS